MLKSFLMPQVWIFVGLILVLLFLVKNKLKICKIVLISVLALYYFLSITPISFLLSYSLEKFSAVNEFKSSDYNQAEAIVVLSGMMYPAGGLRKETELVKESLRRIFYGIKIYREAQGALPVIFSGGPATYFSSIENGKEIIRDDISILGVPENDIIIELNSKNTYESALETKKILDNKFPLIKNHKILLVTSAMHMLRAEKVFKKQGFSVLMVPAGYETGQITFHFRGFIPDMVNFERSNSAIYEWMGILNYKILKKI